MTGKEVNKASTELKGAVLECLARAAHIDGDDRVAVLGLLTGKLREEVDRLREDSYVQDLEADDE